MHSDPRNGCHTPNEKFWGLFDRSRMAWSQMLDFCLKMAIFWKKCIFLQSKLENESKTYWWDRMWINSLCLNYINLFCSIFPCTHWQCWLSGRRWTWRFENCSLWMNSWRWVQITQIHLIVNLVRITIIIICHLWWILTCNLNRCWVNILCCFARIWNKFN